jgi:hypothetical protein
MKYRQRHRFLGIHEMTNSEVVVVDPTFLVDVVDDETVVVVRLSLPKMDIQN